MANKPPPQIRHRPRTAHGKFLRILTVNDVYNLETYPRFAWGVQAAKDLQEDLDCVVKSFLPGDFLSPAVHTSLDNGKALMGGLNLAKVDYLSLGNHEFDIGFGSLEARMKEFKGTYINSNINEPSFLETDYPDHVIFDIGDRKAVIGAYLTDKMDIYPPNWTPQITPIDYSIPMTWAKAKEALGGRIPDLFIPMTHQLMHQDSTTYKSISKHKELGSRTPVMLGGHDHEVYLEEAGCGMIVKVGYNAQKVGVIDIWWDVEGKMNSSISLVPIEEFPEYWLGKEYAEKKEKQLGMLMSVPITTIPFSGTTKLIRFGETPVAKFLMSSVKEGLKQFNVEVSLLQAGAIRGLSDYEAGPFTMGNLFAEFAYELKIGIIDVPGWVVAETVKNTRSLPKPAPPFVHLDEDCEVDSNHDVITLDGKPIVMDKIYRCCTWVNALKGVDNLQPLVDYVHDNDLMPDEEVCIPGKEIVLELFMKRVWQNIIHFDEWDVNHDGVISAEELKAGLDKTIAELDKNGDGVIDKVELVAFLEKGKHEEHNRELAVQMFKILDDDHDGVLSREELAKLVV